MRALFTLAALLAGTANVSAQMPPAQTAPSPAEQAELDGYLNRWEQTMAGVTTLSAVLTRVDTDQVFKAATKYEGWAAYMKSGTGLTALNKAILELKPDGKKEISEKVVCTGTYAYVYQPLKKEIQYHEMPRGKGGAVADTASLGLMFGMKASVAKERFGLTLVKVDANYIYVAVTPKKPEDRVEFLQARLVLDKNTFLPRQVWLKQPNANEVLWDMHRIASGVKIDPRHFDAPRPGDGWKVVPAPKEAPGATTAAEKPRVIRPASP
ncbi:MAG: TIGR03009 domain-containing protein [Gemmataceae bacterium]